MNEGQRARDRAVIERRARTEDVSLEAETERAKAKLRGVDRA